MTKNRFAALSANPQEPQVRQSKACAERLDRSAAVNAITALSRRLCAAWAGADAATGPHRSVFFLNGEYSTMLIWIFVYRTALSREPQLEGKVCTKSPVAQ